MNEIVKHGHGGYIKGCRCLVCTKAKAAYMKKYRESWGANRDLFVKPKVQKIEESPPPPPFPFFLPTGIKNESETA